MRIGIVTSSYPISAKDTVNAGVFVRDIAFELAKFGNEVHVLSPKKYGEVEYSTVVKENYFPWAGGAKDLASASLRNPITLFQYTTLVVSGLLSIRQFVQDNQLDSLVGMWAIPSGIFCWTANQKFGIPYGIWALGSDIWARKKYPFGETIVRKVLEQASFRFADGVQLAKDVESIAGLPCNFVPSVRRLPASLEIEPPTIKQDYPNLLYIGRYERNKGPDILIEAACHLLDSGYKFYLHMFGVGSLQKSLEERVRGYGDFILLNGYANQVTVIQYMQACNWLIIPSRIESIPLIFGDAIQMRLPIIATRVGDMGVLVENLKVGFSVPPSDYLALGEAISKALEYGKSFSVNWEEAQETFDLQESALRCQTELEKAVNRK